MNFYELICKGYLKIEEVDELPSWSNEYYGRLVFVRPLNELYFGSRNQWRRILSGENASLGNVSLRLTEPYTNQFLTWEDNSGYNIVNSNVAIPINDSLVGVTDSQELFNKNIDGNLNNISNIDISDINKIKGYFSRNRLPNLEYSEDDVYYYNKNAFTLLNNYTFALGKQHISNPSVEVFLNSNIAFQPFDGERYLYTCVNVYDNSTQRVTKICILRTDILNNCETEIFVPSISPGVQPVWKVMGGFSYTFCNGKLYLFCGTERGWADDGEYIVPYVYEYDPNTNTITRHWNYPDVVSIPSLVVDGNDIYCINGTFGSTRSASTKCYRFNVVFGTFTFLGYCFHPYRRCGCALKGDYLYLLGGGDSSAAGYPAFSRVRKDNVSSGVSLNNINNTNHYVPFLHWWDDETLLIDDTYTYSPGGLLNYPGMFLYNINTQQFKLVRILRKVGAYFNVTRVITRDRYYRIVSGMTDSEKNVTGCIEEYQIAEKLSIKKYLTSSGNNWEAIVKITESDLINAGTKITNIEKINVQSYGLPYEGYTDVKDGYIYILGNWTKVFVVNTANNQISSIDIHPLSPIYNMFPNGFKIVGNYLYYFGGYKGGVAYRNFYRFDLNNLNNFLNYTELALIPDTVSGSHRCLSASTNQYIFVLNRNTNTFWRYNILNNTWEVLTPFPNTINEHFKSMMVVIGNFVYVYGYNTMGAEYLSLNFNSYPVCIRRWNIHNPNNGSWESVTPEASIPAVYYNFAYGQRGDYVYFYGSKPSIWSYKTFLSGSGGSVYDYEVLKQNDSGGLPVFCSWNLTTNDWNTFPIQLSDSCFNVYFGPSMDNNKIYAFYGQGSQISYMNVLTFSITNASYSDILKHPTSDHVSDPNVIDNCLSVFMDNSSIVKTNIQLSPDDNMVGITDVQSIENKTIDAAENNIVIDLTSNTKSDDVPVSRIQATGTRGSNTVLCDDGTWKEIEIINGGYQWEYYRFTNGNNTFDAEAQHGYVIDNFADTGIINLPSVIFGGEEIILKINIHNGYIILHSSGFGIINSFINKVKIEKPIYLHLFFDGYTWKTVGSSVPEDYVSNIINGGNIEPSAYNMVFDTDQNELIYPTNPLSTVRYVNIYMNKAYLISNGNMYVYDPDYRSVDLLPYASGSIYPGDIWNSVWLKIDDKAYLIGGGPNNESSPNIYEYNFVTNQWRYVSILRYQGNNLLLRHVFAGVYNDYVYFGADEINGASNRKVFRFPVSQLLNSPPYIDVEFVVEYPKTVGTATAIIYRNKLFIIGSNRRGFIDLTTLQALDFRDSLDIGYYGFNVMVHGNCCVMTGWMDSQKIFILSLDDYIKIANFNSAVLRLNAPSSDIYPLNSRAGCYYPYLERFAVFFGTVRAGTNNSNAIWLFDIKNSLEISLPSSLYKPFVYIDKYILTNSTLSPTNVLIPMKPNQSYMLQPSNNNNKLYSAIVPYLYNSIYRFQMDIIRPVYFNYYDQGAWYYYGSIPYCSLLMINYVNGIPNQMTDSQLWNTGVIESSNIDINIMYNYGYILSLQHNIVASLDSDLNRIEMDELPFRLKFIMLFNGIK